MENIDDIVAEKRHTLLCVENLLDNDYITPEKSESLKNHKKQLEREIEELLAKKN